MGVAGPGRRSQARPFVGRTTERRLLRHLLRDASERRPATVVVSGAPGAGKSALLDWAAAAAADAGAAVLRASGYESSLPFAALRRLLAPLPELAAAVYVGNADRPGDGPPGDGPGDGPPGDDQAGGPIDGGASPDLVRLLVDGLADRARRRPLALLLDDVQDLGEASSTVLLDTLLALDDEAARSRLPLFVMLTTRHPMAVDGLADRVLRLPTTRALTVEGFDDRDVFELLAATGERPRPAVVRELLEDTGGLPLLVESEIERRRGRPEPGGAPAGHRAGDARVRSIADALQRRFDKVDTATRRMLEQAAVLGDPWSPEELTVVVGRPSDEVADRTDAAEEARLVVRGRQGVRFAHPLVRSELLDRLTDDRCQALHRTIADRLRTLHGSRGELDDEAMVRVADHLLRGGREVPPEDIAETAGRAGRIAAAWTAWDQASRFLTASAEASAGRQPAATSAGRFLEAGRAAYYDHDGDLATSLLGRAISLAERAGDHGVRLTAALLLARMRGGRGFRLGDRLDLSELEAALRSDPPVAAAVRVEAEAALAEGLIVSGETDAALAIVASARRRAAATPDRSTEGPLGRVDFAEGIHRLTQLELDRADACFASGLRHSTVAGNVRDQNLARSRRALSGLMRGEVGRSYAELASVEEQELAARFWGEAGLAAAQMAFADVLAGRPAADDRIDQAHRLWGRTGFPWAEAVLSATQAAHASRSGRPGADPGDDASRSDRPHRLPMTSAVAALAAVEAYDVPGARAIAGTARWRHGFGGPPTMNNGAVAVALVEVGDLLDDGAMVRSAVPALAAMYERGVLVTIPWPAVVPRLLAVAARHAGDEDLARRYLDHACGLADREDLAPEQAKALLERARLTGRDAVGGGDGVGGGDAVGGGDGVGGGGARRGDDRTESALAEAVRTFDELSMHGWVARCDDVARQMHLPAVASSTGMTRERTIFTDDIVGSTAANARLGDPLYLEQLRVHDRLVRGRLRECRGAEIKHTGDGLNAVFDEPADAVSCALAVMADFRAWSRHEPDLALAIRCGLARGRLIPSDGDFYGLVQSEAARLCGLAGPGEVLATAAVVDGDGGSGVAAESLGQHALRGFPFAIEVFRLAAV
jgi:class 3 adenylate cyclase